MKEVFENLERSLGKLHKTAIFYWINVKICESVHLAKVSQNKIFSLNSVTNLLLFPLMFIFTSRFIVGFSN